MTSSWGLLLGRRRIWCPGRRKSLGFLVPGDCREKGGEERQEGKQLDYAGPEFLFLGTFSVMSLQKASVGWIPCNKGQHSWPHPTGQHLDGGFRLYSWVSPYSCVAWTSKREPGVHSWGHQSKAEEISHRMKKDNLGQGSSTWQRLREAYLAKSEGGQVNMK